MDKTKKLLNTTYWNATITQTRGKSYERRSGRKTKLEQVVRTSKEYKAHNRIHISNKGDEHIARNSGRYNRNDLKRK